MIIIPAHLYFWSYLGILICLYDCDIELTTSSSYWCLIMNAATSRCAKHSDNTQFYLALAYYTMPSMHLVFLATNEVEWMHHHMYKHLHSLIIWIGLALVKYGESAALWNSRISAAMWLIKEKEKLTSINETNFNIHFHERHQEQLLHPLPPM